MIVSSVSRLMAVTAFSFCVFVLQAQPVSNQAVKKEAPPFRVSTSGKQITVRSNKRIEHIMLWTTNGHRIVEQRDINAASYTFSVPVNDKIFFLMVGLDGGKIYTEKIGMQ